MEAPARVDYLREYNEALVVAIARRTPTFDRAGIAEATGLTPQAVSKVIARLVESGLVAHDGVRRTGVGKPAIVYRLVTDSRYAIGAHVTRRTLRVVLTDLAGEIHHSSVTPLPADFTPDEMLDRLAAEIDLIDPAAKAKLVGVGIGMVGPLDYAAGVVRDAHGLHHWHDVALRDLATARLRLPVLMDKDVTAGVVAEAWRRGSSFRDAALIMVESGIGAGLWLDGSTYRGAHTNAGEFGHTVIQLDGPQCLCGRFGCVEILHNRALAGGDVAFAARVLASGVVNLLQTVDLSHVVLAGADFLRHEQVYRDAVAATVRAELPRADWLTVDITPSSLGADVVAAGAAMEMLNACYGLRSPSDARLVTV